MLMTRAEHEDLNIPVWESLCIALVPLPAGLLGAALLSDGLYWLTGAAVCALASEWLLGAGLATGLIAAANGLIRYLSAGSVRLSKRYWMHVGGTALALLLSASNLIYRLNADPAGAVLPAGIALTAIVVCLLIVAGYLGRVLGPRALAEDGDDWEFL
jgi:uncharacterized membrane protein